MWRLVCVKSIYLGKTWETVVKLSFCLLLQRILPSLISDTPNCENKFTKLTKKSRLKGQDFIFYQHSKNEDTTYGGMSKSVKKIGNFCLQL